MAANSIRVSLVCTVRSNYVFEKGLSEQKPPEDSLSETMCLTQISEGIPAWPSQCTPVT
jgi:hypothetical protein